MKTQIPKAQKLSKRWVLRELILDQLGMRVVYSMHNLRNLKTCLEHTKGGLVHSLPSAKKGQGKRITLH